MTDRRGILAIDLFSGPGGMTQGLRDAGCTVVGAVELDALAAETYGLNHAGVRVWPLDIRNVDADEMRRELGLRRGRLDILACCPPCQGFSTIRTRRRRVAVKDDRNALIDEVLRFVLAFEPKAVLFENVPGLARHSRYRRFRSGLAQLGYRTRSQVVDAQSFGVPQRRARLILAATRGRPPRMASPAADRVTVRDAFAGLGPAGRSGDALHDVPERRSRGVAELIAAIPHDGGSRSALGEARQLACHQRLNGFHDVYGRMAWSHPAPTITGGCVNPSKGRFLHPDEDRAITLREAAILQSFPADYRFSLRRGKLAVAEMIGNALPPLLVQKQAAAVIAGMRSRRRTPMTKSEQMARVRRTGTGPELAVRRALWRSGLRYRLGMRLHGKPDIVFPAPRLVVFVDGCFWHRCPRHETRPKTNHEKWQAKLDANVDRDRRVDATLLEEGWRVLRIWEHEVDDPDLIVERVRRAVGPRKSGTTALTHVGQAGTAGGGSRVQ